MNRPTLKEDCNVLFKFEEKWYSVLIDPGLPGNTAGPPDSWEPPEPGYIEMIYQWTGDDWWMLPDTEEVSVAFENAAWDSYENPAP